MLLINSVIILLIIIGILLASINNKPLFKNTIIFSFFCILMFFIYTYVITENVTFNTIPIFLSFINIQFNFISLFVFSFIIASVFLKFQTNKNYTEIGIIFSYFSSSLGIIYNTNLYYILIYWEIMAVLGVIIIALSNSPIKKAIAINYFIVHALSGVLFLIAIINYYNLYNSFNIHNLKLNYITDYLLLAAILINLALPPFSAWLVKGYSHSSTIGAIFLAIYTTKSAIFLLFNIFSGNEILVIFSIVIIMYAFIFACFENDLRKLLAYSIMHSIGITIYCFAYTNNAIVLSYIIFSSLFKMPIFFIIHYLQQKFNNTNINSLHKSINIYSISGVIIIIFMLENIGFIGLSSYVTKYYLHNILNLTNMYIEYGFTIFNALGLSILALPLMHQIVLYKKSKIDISNIKSYMASIIIFIVLISYFIFNIAKINIFNGIVYSLETFILGSLVYYLVYKTTKNHKLKLQSIALLVVTGIKGLCLEVLQYSTTINIYKPVLLAKQKMNALNYKKLSYIYSSQQTFLILIIFAVFYILMLTF